VVDCAGDDPGLSEPGEKRRAVSGRVSLDSKERAPPPCRCLAVLNRVLLKIEKARRGSGQAYGRIPRVLMAVPLSACPSRARVDTAETDGWHWRLESGKWEVGGRGGSMSGHSYAADVDADVDVDVDLNIGCQLSDVRCLLSDVSCGASAVGWQSQMAVLIGDHAARGGGHSDSVANSMEGAWPTATHANSAVTGARVHEVRPSLACTRHGSGAAACGCGNAACESHEEF
jgi:hypothetical protein